MRGTQRRLFFFRVPGGTQRPCGSKNLIHTVRHPQNGPFSMGRQNELCVCVCSSLRIFAEGLAVNKSGVAELVVFFYFVSAPICLVSSFIPRREVVGGCEFLLGFFGIIFFLGVPQARKGAGGVSAGKGSSRFTALRRSAWAVQPLRAIQALSCMTQDKR